MSIKHTQYAHNGPKVTIREEHSWSQVMRDLENPSEHWRKAGVAAIQASADYLAGRITKEEYTDVKRKLPSVLPGVGGAPSGTPWAGLDIRYHNGGYGLDLDVNLPEDPEERGRAVQTALDAVRGWKHSVSWGPSTSDAAWAVSNGPVAQSTEEYLHYLNQIRKMLPEAAAAIVDRKNSNEFQHQRFLCPGRGQVGHNPENVPVELEPFPESPPSGGGGAGTKPRRERYAGGSDNPHPDEWLERCPGLVRKGRQLEGPCPSCGTGDNRLHVNLKPPYKFGCRQCRDPKTGKMNMDPLWAAFPERKRGPAGIPPTIPGPNEAGPWFRIGFHSGQRLQGVWIRYRNEKAPAWIVYRDGTWRYATTTDFQLMDGFASQRLRISGELEDAGWQEGGKMLAQDYLWSRQKGATSDFMAGVRLATDGVPPKPARFHVGVANGCVHLPTGGLHPWTPECGQWSLTAGNYRPDDIDKLEPLIRSYMKTFSPEMQSRYLELVGLSLTGEASGHRALVIILGEPGSGKGGYIALQRVALGDKGAAIKNSWFDRPPGDIDAIGAELLENHPASIAMSELGFGSLRHQEAVLSTIGGEEPLNARRPHGPLLTGMLTAMWWTSCVKLPGFPGDTGIERRLCILETSRKLKPVEKRPDALQDQDLLDALVTLAIEQIRRVGYFSPGPAGYVPPGGAEDVATARGLQTMDPLPGWLDNLSPEWDGQRVEDARAAAMEELNLEFSERAFGDRISASERWDKRRTTVDAVKAMRLFLVGRTSHPVHPVPSETPEKPDLSTGGQGGQGSTGLQINSPGGGVLGKNTENGFNSVKPVLADEIPFDSPAPAVLCERHGLPKTGWFGCPECDREEDEAEANPVPAGPTPSDMESFWCRRHNLGGAGSECPDCRDIGTA